MFKVGDRVVDARPVQNGLGAGTVTKVLNYRSSFPGQYRVDLDDTAPGIFEAHELRHETPQPDTNAHDYHLGYEQGYHFTKRMLPTLAGGKSADYVAGFRAGLDFQHAEAVMASEAQLTREAPTGNAASPYVVFHDTEIGR